MWRSGVSGVRTPAPAYNMQYPLPTELSSRGFITCGFILDWFEFEYPQLVISETICGILVPIARFGFEYP